MAGKKKCGFSCIDLILPADWDKCLSSQEGAAKARVKGCPCVPVLYILICLGDYRCPMEGYVPLPKLSTPCDKAMSAQRPVSHLFY